MFLKNKCVFILNDENDSQEEGILSFCYRSGKWIKKNEMFPKHSK